MMLMILPPRPCSIISLATCLVKRNAPPRMTASCFCHSSNGISSTPLRLKNAALFTSTSTPPKASLAFATAALTCDSSVTSQVQASARPPLPVIACAQSRAFSVRESTQTSAAPSAASPSAIPPPIFGLVPVTIATLPSSLMSRSRDEEAFRGVEDPGVDEFGFLGFAAELGQRPGQAHPVEQLLLAAVLHRGRGIAPPFVVATRTKRVIHSPVGGDVRVQEMVLRSKKCVRPARRRQQRHSPGTGLENSRRRRAEIEQARGSGSGRIQIRLRGRIFEGRQAAALCDHAPAVTVDRERDDSEWKSGPIVVEIENRIGKSVTEGMMQRLVGVGRIKARIDQPAGKVFRGALVALDAKFLVGRFVPDILRWRAELEDLKRVDAVSGNDLFAKILVLIIAPDDDEVGLERVERRANLAQPDQVLLAMPPGRRGSFVTAPLLAHRRRPSGGPAVLFGQARIGKHAFENPVHRLVGTGEWRIVSYSSK